MNRANTSRRALHFVAVAAVVGGASLCSADVIQGRFNDVSPRRTVSISSDAGQSYMNTYAGSFEWSRTGGDYAGAGAFGSFTTYCIELSQHISFGRTYDYTVRDPEASPVPGGGMGAGRAALLSELFGRFYSPQFLTNDAAAAFQVAVWELSHDDGLNLAAGSIRVVDNGAWYGTAQEWLDALDGGGPRMDLLAMTHSTAQDQIFAVPNASTAALLLTGGIFGAAGRRRRDPHSSKR